MAITVNGAILRNMPEQISKNVEDIADLKTASTNHETRITALEAGAIALATFQDCTFTGTTTISGTAFNVNVPATFTAGLTANTITAATVTASGNANITGDLTISSLKSSASQITCEKPIVTSMTGYSYSHSSVPAYIGIDYAGVSRNGNKLTLVVVGNISGENVAASLTLNIGTFNIPASVGNTLVPIGQTSEIDFRKVFLYEEGDLSNSDDIFGYITKYSSTALIFAIKTNSALSNTKTYHFRYEVTFLLSNNLAQ